MKKRQRPWTESEQEELVKCVGQIKLREQNLLSVFVSGFSLVTRQMAAPGL